MPTIEENKERFESLLSSVQRDGIDRLIAYIRKTDFYTAPASTKFHQACEGGHLQHSLNVYDCLAAKKYAPIWKDILADTSDESIILVALLHDLCKAGFYVEGTKNQKTYDADKVAAAAKWQVKHDTQGDFIWETVKSYQIEDQIPLGDASTGRLMSTDGFPKNFRFGEFHYCPYGRGSVTDSDESVTGCSLLG